MKSFERIDCALRGDKPDRVPILPIYDYGYIMLSAGRDIRDYITATSKQRIAFIEEGFIRHGGDGCMVHTGCNDNWAAEHQVEKHEGYWLVEEKTAGRRYRLLPDGCEAREDGSPFAQDISHDMFLRRGVPAVTSEENIDEAIPPVPTPAVLEESGRFRPLKHMADRYPDHHFSFQVSSPFVRSINACGGYMEGLITMAGDSVLFRRIMERYTARMGALLAPGKKAGGRSIWFTSYYCGGDTISPRDYADMVFPYEKMVCEKAKAMGLSVIYWFLGDLMPILDKVLELPIDVLYLEQGRKGYDMDPVEIRKRAGERFCLSGYGYEMDYCTFNKEGLKGEFLRQFEGAGQNGAFIAGTPIMPPNANPAAVDYYFEQIRQYGIY